MSDPVDSLFTQADLDKNLSLLFQHAADEEEKALLDTLSTHSLITEGEKKQKIKQGKKELQAAFQRFANDHDWLKGLDLIIIHIRMNSALPDRHKIEQEWESVPDRMVKMLESDRELEGTWQSVLELSNQSMELAYECALDHYDRQKFALAIQVLCTLEFFNPGYFDSWFLQGICRQELEQWELALASFSMAILLEPKVSLAYWYSAYCYDQLDQNSMAQEFCRLAKELIQPEGYLKATIDSIDENIRLKRK